MGGTLVEGASLVPPNTVYLARANRTADTSTSPDGTAAGAMSPTQMRVPVGTTVTFLNPGAATFPNFPNTKPHCATQYFEGLFNFKLNPGQSAQYTFNRAGEYFFNDCTDPRPTSKVIAYLTPQDAPGAVRFTPATFDFSSPTEVFTGVTGEVTAHFEIPDGYTLDGGVTLKTPLTTTLFPAASVQVTGNGKRLQARFNRADIDNNMPAGDSVPLTFTANFIHNGVQKQLSSTALVRVVK